MKNIEADFGEIESMTTAGRGDKSAVIDEIGVGAIRTWRDIAAASCFGCGISRRIVSEGISYGASASCMEGEGIISGAQHLTDGPVLRIPDAGARAI